MAILLTRVAGGAQPVPAAPLSFDGSWRGPLTFLVDSVNIKAGDPPRSTTYQLDICGSEVHVFVVEPTGLEEWKRGNFHIHAHMTNATIFEIDSGQDNDGVWVESWTFTLTLRNATTVLAAYSRVVNNSNMPAANTKWAMQAQGDLRKLANRQTGGSHGRKAGSEDPRDPCKLVA